ncbi:MAG: type VI secretion protein, partial [Alphaproteobacteria bacterium]|nr:type VI secretion protein [Alphaproteobacteria bacterium]
MAPNATIRERSSEERERDPREAGAGAQIIDLATRNVLPLVSQRKRADSLGLVAGFAIVAALGALTLWSMDAARKSGEERVAAPSAQPQTLAPAGAPVPAPPVPGNPSAAPLQGAVQPSPVLAAPPQDAAAYAANPHASPTVVFDAGALPATVEAAIAGLPGPNAGTGNSNEDFAARIGGAGSGAATASSTFD